MNIGESILAARKIHRRDRVTQGYSTVRAMADHIRHLTHIRTERAARTDALRRSRNQLCQRLETALRSDPILAVQVRRETSLGSEYTPPIRVKWGAALTTLAGRGYQKYHWYNGGAAGTVYHPSSTRNIQVSAAHALALLMRAGREPTAFLTPKPKGEL